MHEAGQTARPRPHHVRSLTRSAGGEGACCQRDEDGVQIVAGGPSACRTHGQRIGKLRLYDMQTMIMNIICIERELVSTTVCEQQHCMCMCAN